MAWGLPKLQWPRSSTWGPDLPNPKYPQVVLYDQYNNAGRTPARRRTLKRPLILSTTSLPTTSSCPAARLGRWSRSMRMGSTSTASDLPRVFMFAFTRMAPGTCLAHWSRLASPKPTCRGAPPLASPSARPSLLALGRTGSRSRRGRTSVQTASGAGPTGRCCPTTPQPGKTPVGASGSALPGLES